MPFFAQAVIDALGEFPVLNASLGDDHIVVHRNVNLGIAVALPEGLIVPVLARADERNFMGLARAIADLAKRARAGALTPEEVQGGTFTITNPGPFGALFGTPIIAQPQVAILGVGGVHKRPVVVERGRHRGAFDGVPGAVLRPPPDRRRGCGPVHGIREVPSRKTGPRVTFVLE